MAVVKCNECGSQVSTKAAACPSCGAKRPKKVGVLGWLFAILVVLPIAWQFGKGVGATDQPVQQATPQWQRSTLKDAMTDKPVEVLSLRSKDSVAFDFPYQVPGGSRLTLSFRKKAEGLDAYLLIDKGQILCSRSDCAFTLRVGDGEAARWTGLKSATHDSDLMFVRDAAQLEAIIKKGGSIRVGLDFHRAGNRAFNFDVAGYPGF